MENIQHSKEADGVQRPRALSRRNFVKLAGSITSLALPAFGQTTVREVGDPRRPYGYRSPFEKSVRYFSPGAYAGTGSARTPLQDLYGITTPVSQPSILRGMSY